MEILFYHVSKVILDGFNVHSLDTIEDHDCDALIPKTICYKMNLFPKAIEKFWKKGEKK